MLWPLNIVVMCCEPARLSDSGQGSLNLNDCASPFPFPLTYQLDSIPIFVSWICRSALCRWLHGCETANASWRSWSFNLSTVHHIHPPNSITTSWFICFSHFVQAFSRRLPSTIPSTSTGEALPRGCRRCGSGPSPPFRWRCSAEISTFRRCWMSWSAAAAAALDVTRGN